MKLTVDELKKQVDEIERTQLEWREMCAVWENMWSLKYFDRPTKQAQAEGHEQVTMPLPYNVVNLHCRLISDDPKVDCPACDVTEEEIATSEKKERWLTAMWQLPSLNKEINLVQGAKWQSAVRGAHVFEVKWVGDKLPKAMRKKHFPILIRNLDPLNVGVREGPLYTEMAYHKYEDDVFAIKQRYPKWESKKFSRIQKNKPSERASVIDAWWVGDEGDIWNAVIIDSEFVTDPWKTMYGMIPIIWGGADVSLATNKSLRNLSILHPLKDIWPIMNRLESLKMTAARWYYDPMITVQNENGEEVGDIEIGPGKTTTVPWGTKIEQHVAVPNHQVLEFIMASMEKAVQEGTYPGVMYGQSPGSLQAGYGVSILSNAAEGRSTSTRYNLERSMEKVNMLALNLVETFSGSEGVRVWGKESGKKEFYYETLTAEEIDGYYENRVYLKNNIPQNDAQDIASMIQMYNIGAISLEWIRDNLPWNLPADERSRVLTEKMSQDPEIQRKLWIQALQKTQPDKWQELLADTQYAPPPEPEQPPMLPPAMPPDMMGGMGMPPPMGDPSMMGMVGPPGMPMPIQPESMNLSAGTFPPNQMPQFTPEQMGLPPDIDPMTWATLMGQQVPPADQLRMLGGM